MYYTGVGSRGTPDGVLKRMNKFARIMHNKGWVLRTGDADGADEAFMTGSGGDCEIYTANDNLPLWTDVFVEHFHPNPQALSPYAHKLMARNALQILSQDAKIPSKFLVCWTKDGKDTGGTGQAIRIARFYNIPVFNFKNDEDVAVLREFVRTI